MAELAGADGAGRIPPVHLIVRLELPNQPPREFSYDFKQATITIGRDPGNDIQIPLTTVSRRHARIFYELGDFFLEDLGSTHGTELNGRRLAQREKKLMRDGDVMRVMSFSLTFKSSMGGLLDRQPGEKTEHLARRMVQEMLSSLGGANADPPALRAMNGPDEGRRYEIRDDQAEVTIGRSPECEFPISDQNASRRHCLIKRTWNGFTAQDLGSKNGVLLNGERLEGAQSLKDGDEIQLGGLKLIFIDPASRILEQFGGLADETVNPGSTADIGTNGEDEDEGEGYEDEGYEDEGYEDEDPDDEPAESSPPFDPSELDDDEGDPEDEIELPDPGEIEVPKVGFGAEVIILLVGGIVLLGAVGLALFLYL